MNTRRFIAKPQSREHRLPSAQQCARRTAARGFDRTAASRGQRELQAFAVGRVSEAGLDVGGGKIGEVLEDFRTRHAGCEVIKHLVHGDAQAAHSWLAAALAGFDGDDVAVIHDRKVYGFSRGVDNHFVLSDAMQPKPLRPNGLRPMAASNRDM